MTWFRVDDGFASHSKARAAGKDGRGLWLAAGTMCAAANSDGVVEPLVVKDAAYLAEVNAKRASDALVAAVLWHDHQTLAHCRRCRETNVQKLAAGAFLFHDWLDYQPTKDQAKIPLERLRWNRRKALNRDRELCAAIVRRDGPHCRYCGQRVDFKSRKGPLSGTYDHVDPDDFSPNGNSLTNVVVACRKCNGDKKDRTPEEAGMPLLPPPDRDLAPARSGLGRDLAPIRPEQAPTRASHARRDGPGPGRAGLQPRSNPGLTPARSISLASLISTSTQPQGDLS